MLNPGQKLDLSFELPDIEKIMTLSIVCVVSALLLSVSFIAGIMWSAEIFEDVEEGTLDWDEENYKEIFLYIGGFVFGIAAIMFAISTLFSIQHLYNLTIKGTTVKIEKATRILYHSCLVALVAMVLLVGALILGEIEAFTDMTGVI